MILTRFRAVIRPRKTTPFRRVDGEWVTNESPVYVRRVKGLPMALSLKPLHGYTSLLTKAELEFVKRVSRRKGWIVKERPANIEIEEYPYLDGDLDCNPELLKRLNQVGKRLKRTVFVRSGLRTIAEQTSLYQQNMNGATGQPKPGRPLTARPNPNAPHVRGIAADCGIDGKDIGDFPGAVDALRAEGLGLPVASEDWHVEITDSMVGEKS